MPLSSSRNGDRGDRGRDAPKKRIRGQIDVAIDDPAGQPVEQPLEIEPRLEASQAGSETVVEAEPKPEVLLRWAHDVEACRLVPPRRVSVCGAKDQRNHGALRD